MPWGLQSGRASNEAAGVPWRLPSAPILSVAREGGGSRIIISGYKMRPQSMGQEQVGIVESSAMQDCALAHIITRMLAFIPAVYSHLKRSFVPFRIAATFS